MESEQSTPIDGIISLSNLTSNSTSNVVALPDEPIVTAISQSAIGVVGICGNLCAVATLSTNRKLRNKIINMYIINQVSVFTFGSNTEFQNHNTKKSFLFLSECNRFIGIIFLVDGWLNLKEFL